MGIIQLILIATGLAMDAFAVAICKGLRMKKIDYKYAALIALFFGGFQAFMPLIGWMLGKQFEQYITSIDHWIIFILLAIIGGKMIAESFEKEEHVCQINYDLKELLLLSIATSIDALAVGITFALVKTDIIIAMLLIGCITFTLSIFGVIIGNRYGVKYKGKAELAGGIILILIGFRMLMEHLGVF